MVWECASPTAEISGQVSISRSDVLRQTLTCKSQDLWVMVSGTFSGKGICRNQTPQNCLLYWITGNSTWSGSHYFFRCFLPIVSHQVCITLLISVQWLELLSLLIIFTVFLLFVLCLSCGFSINNLKFHHPMWILSCPEHITFPNSYLFWILLQADHD